MCPDWVPCGTLVHRTGLSASQAPFPDPCSREVESFRLVVKVSLPASQLSHSNPSHHMLFSASHMTGSIGGNAVAWLIRTWTVKVPYFTNVHWSPVACPVFSLQFGQWCLWVPPLVKGWVGRRVNSQTFLHTWLECHQNGIQASLWTLKHLIIYQDSWIMFTLNSPLISPTHLMKSQTFILIPSATLL